MKRGAHVRCSPEPSWTPVLQHVCSALLHQDVSSDICRLLIDTALTITHTDASRCVFVLFACPNRSSYCTEPAPREHIHIRKRAEFRIWGSFLRRSDPVCWRLLYIPSPTAFHFRFVGRRRSQAAFQRSLAKSVCERKKHTNISLVPAIKPGTRLNLIRQVKSL